MNWWSANWFANNYFSSNWFHPLVTAIEESICANNWWGNNVFVSNWYRNNWFHGTCQQVTATSTSGKRRDYRPVQPRSEDEDESILMLLS